MRTWTSFFIYLFTAALVLGPGLYARATDDRNIWAVHMAEQARSGGYGLITYEALTKLITADEDFVLVDVRTQNEFEEGSLGGAVWVEINRAEKEFLKPGKRRLMLDALGPDKKRRVIFYCRSFR